MKKETASQQQERLNAFHTEDEDVDLSIYGVESWIAVGFFWLLGITVFHQFFTRYVLNDSAGMDGGNCSLFVDCKCVLWEWRLA